MELINSAEWNLKKWKKKNQKPQKQTPNLFPLRRQLKLYKPSGSFIGTAHFNQCFCVDVFYIQKKSIHLVWNNYPNNRHSRQGKREQVLWWHSWLNSTGTPCTISLATWCTQDNLCLFRFNDVWSSLLGKELFTLFPEDALEQRAFIQDERVIFPRCSYLFCC